MSKEYINSKIRRTVLKRDGRRCRYCGSTKGPFHFDHVYPESKGGETSVGNLVVSCESCNHSKNARVGIWPLPIMGDIERRMFQEEIEDAAEEIEEYREEILSTKARSDKMKSRLTAEVSEQKGIINKISERFNFAINIIMMIGSFIVLPPIIYLFVWGNEDIDILLIIISYIGLAVLVSSLIFAWIVGRIEAQ